ncbi:MAG: hypothetical protein BroJett040_00730 [Oligoflexia bacterium]|nr:MAG: hypothetical protein BroJett040_00730 [Oligoflexia bacterium]
MKKIISTVLSFCTTLAKPHNDLDVEQWQQIEFRQSSRLENSNPLKWGL